MRKLSGLIASSTFAVLLFAACGGGDPVQPPQAPVESPGLDFSAIAGEWEGTWACCQGESGFLVAILKASAVEGRLIGTAQWLDEARVLESRVNWLALSAEPPMYTVEEKIVEGTGSEGLIFLEHNPEAGTLDWRFQFAGGAEVTGTLTRK